MGTARDDGPRRTWHRALELDDALSRALDHDGFALVEVLSDANLV